MPTSSFKKDDHMSDYKQQITFCPECRKKVEYQMLNVEDINDSIEELFVKVK